jgi:hypothetical protein
VSFGTRESLTPAQGGVVSDVMSLEEAWARFPIAMERANLGIGHLMGRPDFVLRLWDDSRSVLAQAAMTPREREGHILRGLLRRDTWPLLIGEITHGMDRGFGGGKRATSWCGKHKVPKRDQKWLESRDRDVDCMGCLASGRESSPRHRRAELEAMRWVCSVKWMPGPRIWSRYGWSFSSHPRREPGRLVGEDEIPVGATEGY